MAPAIDEMVLPEHAVVVFSDIACPWAHVAIHRFARARRTLGLADEIRLDHRAFPLELINHRPTPKDLLDAEVAALAPLEPDATWSTEPRPWTYPVSSLPALEAVQAAKSQGAEMSVALDAALRRAMFGSWQCVSVFSVVLAIAAEVPDLDVDRLWEEIRAGAPRTEVFEHLALASSEVVPGSPTFLLSDGSVWHNPGIDFEHVDGSIRIESDEPAIYERMLERARALQPAD